MSAAIAEGADQAAARKANREGFTPLLLAAKLRDLRSVELLLPLSDPLARDRMLRDALFLAILGPESLNPSPRLGDAEEQDRQTAETLEKLAPFCGGLAQNDCGVSALMVAASQPMPRCLAVLAPISDLAAVDAFSQNALSRAAAANLPRQVDLLLSWQAPSVPDAKGRDALAIAIECAAAESVQTLLAHRHPFDGKNMAGQDPLEQALSLGREPRSAAPAANIVRQLLKAWQSRPDGAQRAQRALWQAMSRSECSPLVATELLGSSDLSARDPDGQNALDLAASSLLNPTILSLLLEAGADPNVRALNGLHPLTQLVSKNLWIFNLDALTGRSKHMLPAVRALASVSCAEAIKETMDLARDHGGAGGEAIAHALNQALAQKEADELRQSLSGGAQIAALSSGAFESLPPSLKTRKIRSL